MDPQEIDLLWEVYQEVGAKEPIQIICGYRSPGTNEMLRGRSASSGVARHSQHTLGKAIDFYIPGVPLEKLRDTAMRLQGGGVGYYPTSGSPFVHLDVGNVRAWPRMTREQLVKLFPDGRTVHLPTDGTPLPGYELAQGRPRARRTAPSPSRRSAASSLRCSAATRTPKRPTTTPRLARTPRHSRSVTAKPEPASPRRQASPARAPGRLRRRARRERRSRCRCRRGGRSIRSPPPKAARPPAPRAAAPMQLASLSPNDIINSRGLWDNFGRRRSRRRRRSPKPTR